MLDVPKRCCPNRKNGRHNPHRRLQSEDTDDLAIADLGSHEQAELMQEMAEEEAEQAAVQGPQLPFAHAAAGSEGARLQAA